MDDSPCVEVAEEVKGDDESAWREEEGSAGPSGGLRFFGVVNKALKSDLLATIAHPNPPSRYSVGRSSCSTTVSVAPASSKSLFSSRMDPPRFATPSGRSVSSSRSTCAVEGVLKSTWMGIGDAMGYREQEMMIGRASGRVNFEAGGVSLRPVFASDISIRPISSCQLNASSSLFQPNNHHGQPLRLQRSIQPTNETPTSFPNRSRH